MVARFQSSVHPGNHMGIRSIAAKMFTVHFFRSVQAFSIMVTASKANLASDETGCGTSPARPQQWVPDLGNMDTPWHPQLGVAVENLGWISGALAACWTRKSSELSSHQILVGGELGQILRAESSSKGPSETPADKKHPS